MVLGDGARDLGAAAGHISELTPGVAYVQVEARELCDESGRISHGRRHHRSRGLDAPSPFGRGQRVHTDGGEAA